MLLRARDDLHADQQVIDLLDMETEIDSMKTQAAGNRLDQIHADLLTLRTGDPDRYNKIRPRCSWPYSNDEWEAGRASLIRQGSADARSCVCRIPSQRRHLYERRQRCPGVEACCGPMREVATSLWMHHILDYGN